MTKLNLTKPITYSLTFLLTFLLFACSQTFEVKSDKAKHSNTSMLSDPVIVNLLNTKIEVLWSESFDHHEKGLVNKVAQAINELALSNKLSDKNIDKLSYYLRIFSSFGPDENWSSGSEKSLNNALIALTEMADFYQITPVSARLHENYAVALYRLYFLESMQPFIVDHIAPLTRLINLYATSALGEDLSVDYAMWEVLRAAAILPYEARRNNKAEFTAAIQLDGKVQTELVQFITAPNAIRKGDNWPQQHASWALANFYNLYNKQYWNSYYQHSLADQKRLDDDKLKLPVEQRMSELDEQVWQALSSDISLTVEQAKQHYSVPYLVGSFRGKSACEEEALKGRCITPTIEEALPINHTCSDSLYILSQSMSATQLHESCKALIAQEDSFHNTLATNKMPVANDFNEKLRVVIFKDAAQYNKYGQLTFDIHTDNGGMYIEGTPQNPENIATFYSYEHFWIRPEFGVWNLNHEYVHYLDGRFVKYDTFNHFPSNLVWWSEGLAEYISKRDDNPKAFKLLVENEQWPSLLEIFNTEYKDGTDRVYQWGYLAVRFMVENHIDQYRQMAHYLKTDYFDGYKKLLDQSGKQYDDEFAQWLTVHKNNFTAVKTEKNKKKPRQFYRYTYKNYLKPSYLVEDKNHMIWQYWHANVVTTID